MTAHLRPVSSRPPWHPLLLAFILLVLLVLVWGGQAPQAVQYIIEATTEARVGGTLHVVDGADGEEDSEDSPVTRHSRRPFRPFRGFKDVLEGRQPGLPGFRMGRGRGEQGQPGPEHYVLHTAVSFPLRGGLEQAMFGTGCFWGTEKGFWKMPGVHYTAVGYTGGTPPHPTYGQVCTGRTGHNEVVMVVYDPQQVSYSDLLRQFWESHDPTQGNRQGNDWGTQYRSGIYTYGPTQYELAVASRAAFQEALASRGKGRITTEIIDAPEFYYAEEYHQQYLAKPLNRQYCSAQPLGISMPPFTEWGTHIEKGAPKLPQEYWRIHGPKPGCTIAGSNRQIKWP